MIFRFRRIVALVAAVFAMLAAMPAIACTTTPSQTGDLGSYSPPAVKTGAVPTLYSKMGLNCQPAILVLLGGNYIKAKFSSQNGMKLLNGANQITYTASLDSGATVPVVQNVQVDYMQNNLLNLLGLLGGSSADFPLYVKPSAAATPPEGVYTDKITVTWNWYLCPGISVTTLLCIGTPDIGINVVTTVDVKLTVAARRMTITTSTTTTYDTVNGTWYPKTLPGARQRIVSTVANPDIVSIDSNTIQLSLAVPPNSRIALEGDGTSTTDFVRFAEGSTQSKVTISYVSPSSTSDDVDFSSDGGMTWTYAPSAGNTASQQAVTNIRLRPRGAMMPNSSFAVSYPVEVK